MSQSFDSNHPSHSSAQHPTLTSMGISSFNQISHFTVDNDDDRSELKIYYQRPTDSPLPRTKKFEFDTAQQAALQQAIAELDLLIDQQAEPLRNREQLALELQQLEQVMHAKMGELRQQLDNWRG